MYRKHNQNDAIKPNGCRVLAKSSGQKARDECFLQGADTQVNQQAHPSSRFSHPRPPREELLEVCRSLKPVTQDQEVCRYLDAMRLNPEVVAENEMAMVLSPKASVPSWAHVCGFPWSSSWRLLFPVFDARGALVSLRAHWCRAVPPPQGAPKAVVAAVGPGSASGLVHCNAPAWHLLNEGRRCAEWVEKPDFCIVITAGETDYLTWATRQSAPQSAHAVFGIWPGAWTQEFGDRIPTGSVVSIRTDLDAAGRAYAKEIQKTLNGRCRVFVKQPATSGETHG